MLEAPFGEDWHFHAGDCFNAATDHFTFECVKAIDVVIGKRNERNAFGDFNHARAREGTESLESEMPRGRISAGVRSAQASAVGERMLYSPDAPAFLVEHLIVHDTSNRQFRIFLDGIILQIF